jgi:predicted transcriptional regulator YdeE
METIQLKQDTTVFGFRVETFPDGIGEAFDTLVQKIPGGFNRSFYGLSFMSETGIVYIASAEEKSPGEAEQLGFSRFTIERGKYAFKELTGWRKKTASIKDIFHSMMELPDIDSGKPCVEWYQDDERMLCMIKLKS